MVEAVGALGASSPGSQVRNVAPSSSKSQAASAESQATLQNQLQNLPLSQVKARLSQMVMAHSLSQAQASVILRAITDRQAQMGKVGNSSKAVGAGPSRTWDTGSSDKMASAYPAGRAVDQVPNSSDAFAEGAGAHIDERG